MRSARTRGYSPVWFRLVRLRFVQQSHIGLRLFFVVFVDRPDERRVISLRKANAREVKRYAET